MKNLKKLTILHSNDMHGDFLAEQIDERLVGGVSLLSGYVNKGDAEVTAADSFKCIVTRLLSAFYFDLSVS